MKKHVSSKWLAFALVISLLFTYWASMPVVAETDDTVNDTQSNLLAVSGGTTGYTEYKEALGLTSLANEKITCQAAQYDNENQSGIKVLESYSGKNNVLDWSSGVGSVSYKIDVPKTGLYCIELSYATVNDEHSTLRLGFLIDGEYPVTALKNIILPMQWKNASEEFEQDNKGNQFAPEQVIVDGFCKSSVRDSLGVVTDPYQIKFTVGQHILTLVGNGTPIILEKVELVPPETTKTYNELQSTYKKSSNILSQHIVIQGENASIKSTASLVPKSDNTSANVTPADSSSTKLNYIGGTTWRKPLETLKWDFDVKVSGYYKLGFKYKQSTIINGESYRWLKIDGVTPFAEAKNIKFPYANKWRFMKYTDQEKKPYYIWLEEGKHQLSMEVTLGNVADLYRRLSGIVDSLSEEYLKIIKITGQSPDVSRDYELFNQIPNFNNTLSENYSALSKLAKDMGDNSQNQSNECMAALNNMARVLKNMLDKPYLAHTYINNYFSNYSTVSAWLYDIKKMPLSLDEIQLVSEDADFDTQNDSFFKSISFGVRRFVLSFIEDYNTISKSGTSDKEITVWVNYGRDQAAALQSLIQDSFTKEKGVTVNLRIVNTSVVNGILSGNYPDVQLSLVRSEPVNLGMRDALYDLSKFKDFKDVLSCFQRGAELPYCYNNACYALPSTQSFFCMFYREDILSSLNLDIPKTWDDFIRISTVIQRNNMQVYLPYTQIDSIATVDQGIGNLNLYPTLLSQNGLSLYNKEKTALAIDSAKEISVFDQWTRLYSDYRFVKQADFYNRFRAGTIPLGIAPYTTCFAFTEMAPEIQGKWDIAAVPGIVEGKNTVSGSGSGCAIINKSKNILEAWEFLKWWTSSDVQAKYSKRVESVLGLVGRIPTANLEAFQNMEWESHDLQVLLGQWGNVQEVPEIPGSYYTSWSIDQAYWSVMNGKSNVKDAVIKWCQIANGEISRKIKEYSN